MTIRQEKNGERLVIAVEGILDSMTAPELEGVVDTQLNGITELLLDLSDLEYTSSAGLRVFLKAQQIMDAKDARMSVRGVNEFVMEIFEDTGFTNILDIEE